MFINEANMDNLHKVNEELSKELRKLRQQNNELKKIATRLSEAAKRSHDEQMSWVYAMEGNRDGVWDWNVVTGEVFYSTRWKEMIGFNEDEIRNELSEWDKRVHPDDKDKVYADLNSHLNGDTPYYENEHRMQCKDGSYKWILDRGKIISWTEDGKPLRVVGTHTDITFRKEVELKNQRLFNELRDALSEIQTLRGILPLCSFCKKIRDDKGYWEQVDVYLQKYSEADISHGICPECLKKHYPEEYEDMNFTEKET
jgi:PAS domain S-box-containing protein